MSHSKSFLLDPYADLLLYQSKMQFLQRIAQTVEGASLLWSNYIMDKIINCQFFDYLPDELGEKQEQRKIREEMGSYLFILSLDSTNKPYIKERYNILLIPFLDLCISLLLMLRSNKEFIGEFVVFIDRHSEVCLLSNCLLYLFFCL